MLAFTLNNKRFRRLKLPLLIAGFWLLVFALSGCRNIGSKPAALQVTSTPEAAVFLDGKHVGKTPFFSDQLRAGEYLLKITVSEASFVDKITLFAGKLTVVNRELNNNLMAQSGEILWLEDNKRGFFVSSMPQDAEVTINGRSYGKAPLLINELEEGEYKVSLSKIGYVGREFAVKISKKYRLIADVILASEIAKGTALLSSPSSSPRPRVEISATPLGFLRVRVEPSLTAPEIGRVKTGDQLEIIQEVKDWVKVSFEGKQGWISAQYTKKL